MENMKNQKIFMYSFNVFSLHKYTIFMFIMSKITIQLLQKYFLLFFFVHSLIYVSA